MIDHFSLANGAVVGVLVFWLLEYITPPLAVVVLEHLIWFIFIFGIPAPRLEGGEG